MCVQVEVDGKDMQSPPEEGLPIRAARLQAKHWWSFRLPIHSQNRNASVKIVTVANPIDSFVNSEAAKLPSDEEKGSYGEKKLCFNGRLFKQSFWWMKLPCERKHQILPSQAGYV